MSQITTRRTFLSAATTGAAAAALSPRLFSASQTEGGSDSPKKRLLVLGGTRFLGPQIVNAALAAGWDVTLFNRGKSGPDMYPELDKRVGDRNENDYASLAEGEWDVCIDTCCYIPAHATAAIEAIKGRVKHFVLISTISVYAEDAGTDGVVAEDAKLAVVQPEHADDFKVMGDVGKHGMRYYGALKALSESAAQAAMPEGGVTIVRPGLIVGPEDGTDRYTYWPVRVARGGEVLAPGNPDAGVQYIDVRDLGVFSFEVGARATGKVYNAVGFDGKVTMKQLIESCIPEGDKKPEDLTITRVDDDFLLEQQVRPWAELPLWIPGGGNHYVNTLAIKDGLKFRSLKDTAAATLAWNDNDRNEKRPFRSAMNPDKEVEVLAAWHAREEK